jgi:hypothetical protein
MSNDTLEIIPFEGSGDISETQTKDDNNELILVPTRPIKTLLELCQENILMCLLSGIIELEFVRDLDLPDHIKTNIIDDYERETTECGICGCPGTKLCIKCAYYNGYDYAIKHFER